jgi:hypothetical protein
MTARETATRLPGISVMSYHPGNVPRTSLGRDNGPVIVMIVSYILPLLMKRDRPSAIPRSGQFLADLALALQYAICTGDYWSVRGTALFSLEPSVLARCAEVSVKLWENSARLAGVRSLT